MVLNGLTGLKCCILENSYPLIPTKVQTLNVMSIESMAMLIHLMVYIAIYS
jgi:hypothetical protein